MKLKNLSAIAVAAAVCGFTSTVANAQTQTTASNGDLFIGFRATGGQGNQTPYLLNIGQASTFRDQAAGTPRVLNLGNAGADLVNLYSNNWFGRNEVLWSVSGGNTASFNSVGGDPGRTLYYSVQDGGAAWSRLASAGQSEGAADMSQQRTAYVQTSTGAPRFSTANSSFGLVQNINEINNYSGFQVGGNQTSAYRTYAGGGEEDFGDGAFMASLDLYRMAPAGAGQNGDPGQLIGTFSISQLGVVTFTAVPEPSVLALVGIGLIGAGTLALRRKRMASRA
jgi:hypothetical protein